MRYNKTYLRQCFNIQKILNTCILKEVCNVTARSSLNKFQNKEGKQIFVIELLVKNLENQIIQNGTN